MSSRALSLLRRRQNSAVVRQVLLPTGSICCSKLSQCYSTARPTAKDHTRSSLRQFDLQRRNMSSSTGHSQWADVGKDFENIKLSTPAPSVALITLNRPKALNALCAALMAEMNVAIDAAVKDDSIGAIVFTGSDKAFAAGADIKEMKDKQYHDVYKDNFLGTWQHISECRKPTIAAVSGYALGGGCELALMCDIIIASPTATFGQPEINLGIIPGAGGTQRLTRAVGKSRAMELVLTGRNFSAQEAERWGVVGKIVGEEPGAVVKEAVSMAEVIASKGRLAVMAAKESVKASYDMTLNEGLRFERWLFHGLFATQDQKEGMAAFTEKRKAKFSHL